ncbi:hypothetical protein BAUCODRAFT_36063 [Baudoinia panamericana UAMH 10762]|uniref:UBA domain-containing protein n=1 Tax=Baudoinia panamericana (strain UAMH 10762) TaxID=717646 RepID=M2ME00_BAUPA|nr:uncharacterized protein BAUCODRAFT_36063 [Baudoinia panamericana UAMH 10762]EMC94801.1 hypothetical protein BAUCODRAFT_36063 [Baudoinia panamericana UAMH 10762]
MPEQPIFASLNGAAIYAATAAAEDFVFDAKPNANAIARRSVSIFSRRGTEVPEPSPPFIAQAAIKTQQPGKQMTERQKSWISRRRSVGGPMSPVKAKSETKKLRGTILMAVPAAKTIQMTTLEEEMATSPNEEILSAVSGHSTARNVTASHPTLPSPSPESPRGSFDSSPVRLAQRTRSERRQDTTDRIGMWANGVAQWDDQLNVRTIQHNQWVEEVIRGETGFSPVHCRPTVDVQASSRVRPTLSLSIPSRKEPKPGMAHATKAAQGNIQRPIISVPPTSILSKFNIATPAITIQAPKDGNDASSVTSIQATPPSTEMSEGDQMNVVGSPECHKPMTSRHSSSTFSSTPEEQHSDGESSVTSKGTSATSVDAAALAIPKKSSKRLSGRVLSARVTPRESFESSDQDIACVDLNKPLPPSPIPVPARIAPSAPQTRGAHKRARSVLGDTKSLSNTTVTSLCPATPRILKTRSMSHLDELDAQFMMTSPYPHMRPGQALGSDCSTTDGEAEPLTPPMTQAENGAKFQLCCVADDVFTEGLAGKGAYEDKPGSIDALPERSTSMQRNESVHSVMQPPERAPTVPRRSRKRHWRGSKVRQANNSMEPRRRSSETKLAVPSTADDCDQIPTFAAIYRSPSAPTLTGDAQVDSSASHGLGIMIDDGLVVTKGPRVVSADDREERGLAAAYAEDVLLNILSSLRCMDDLFNTALINKGMYRVYKENALQLLRTVAFNKSPAAWEFREWCPPDRNPSDSSSKASSQLEHTPVSYMRCYRRDVVVIESLKALMVKHCHTFVRRETVFAISTPTHPHAQRFNDAFWRIWCFCKIFGYQKGREDDVTGQLDWLKGGLLADNQGCVATVNTNLDFDMGSILLNAPDHFAKGNVDGLSSQQLYDLTEIWQCLTALLQGYLGHTDLARDAGVFDDCTKIEAGDVVREEQTLEEWCYYLLTLGPAVVLQMAEHATTSPAAGFTSAKVNGWTRWTATTHSGSRGTFFREPVSRLYEERITAAVAQNPCEQEKKDMSRKRVASLAAEIRLRRQSSSYKRSPYIDMHTERSMSVLSRRTSSVEAVGAQAYNGMMSPLSSAQCCSPATMSPCTPSVPRPQIQYINSPWQVRKISPIIEERVENFNRLSLQCLAGVAEGTSEHAVNKIVDMGFTAAQAKHALRITDMGDGLRVDRAVDLLIRQKA